MRWIAASRGSASATSASCRRAAPCDRSRQCGCPSPGSRRAAHVASQRGLPRRARPANPRRALARRRGRPASRRAIWRYRSCAVLHHLGVSRGPETDVLTPRKRKSAPGHRSPLGRGLHPDDITVVDSHPGARPSSGPSSTSPTVLPLRRPKARVRDEPSGGGSSTTPSSPRRSSAAKGPRRGYGMRLKLLGYDPRPAAERDPRARDRLPRTHDRGRPAALPAERHRCTARTSTPTGPRRTSSSSFRATPGTPTATLSSEITRSSRG